MTSEAKPRSWWSTSLVSIFGGAFGGFLWIGRGKLAVASLVLAYGFLAYAAWRGFPALAIPDETQALVSVLQQLLFAALALALVLPFRRRSQPVRWYSNGVVVILLVLATGVLPAPLIRSFLLQPFSFPSTSMSPSLEAGDYFFADKKAYGYSRYSVPFGLLPIDGRVFAREPVRGDIVAFRFPPNPDIDYVMRLVGLPGETVQMIGGVLTINGEPVRMEEVGPYETAEGDAGRLQRETLPNGVSHYVLNLVDGSIGDDTRPFTVPEGTYFVLGDNRDNAADSRFNVGFVPYENLVGKVVRLFWNSRGLDYSSRQIGSEQPATK